MKECSNCGAQVDDAAAVCRYCATQLEGGSAVHTQPFAPEPPRAPEPPPYEPPRQPEPPREAPPAQDPYRQAYQSRPQQPPPGAPYGQQPPPGAPYGQQPPPGAPYGQQPPPGAPYGQQPPPGAPYGQQPPPGAPYGQQPPPGAPYGQQPPPGAPYGQQPYPQQIPPHAMYDPRYRNAQRIPAGILALIVGGLGVHKFYMGKVGLGILYLLFCWTGIPSIIGLVEGIIYLCQDDYTFRERYCRLY